MKEFKIGIVVADTDEYKPLADIVEKGEFEVYPFLGRTAHKFKIASENASAEVISILCGIGKVNAAAAAMHLADIGCDYILNYGLSGGISGISKNELCFCDRFLEHDFDLTGLGYKPCEKPSQKYVYTVSDELFEIVNRVISPLKKGTAVTGDRFICDAAVRDYFKNEFSAMSCDMETAAIAYVADSANIPFISVRRISDDAGEDASDSYVLMNTSNETFLCEYVLDVIKELIKQ